MPRGTPLGGSLIAISERGLDDAGNLLAFIIGGPTPGTFTVKRSGDFDISDAALLPPGDLLVLERRFSFLSRRRHAHPPHPARRACNQVRSSTAALCWRPIWDIRSTIWRDLRFTATASGETVLTLISDDNFSAIQRTVLLQFTGGE